MPSNYREELEMKRLQELVNLRDKEIKDIKKECAEQFKRITELCFVNDYKNKQWTLRKIYEIASDNFSALTKDMVISEESKKIIELSTTDQSNR